MDADARPQAHTIVLGGGCSGLAAAQRLRLRLPDAARYPITLIDADAIFVVRAALNSFVGGAVAEAEVLEHRERLLPASVRFVAATIQRLDALSGEIFTDVGVFRADFIVVALGADTHKTDIAGFDITEALAMGCCPYTLEGARLARRKLVSFLGGEIVICIASRFYKQFLSPFELAFILHSHFAAGAFASGVHITIVSPEPSLEALFGAAFGARIEAELHCRRITFLPSKVLVTAAVSTSTLKFADDTELIFDWLLLVPPHTGPAVLERSGLVDETGWVPVHRETMRTTTAPASSLTPSAEVADACEGAVGKAAPETRTSCTVFAVGDCTSILLPGDATALLPKSGSLSVLEGRVAAEQIAAIVLATAGAMTGSDMRASGAGHAETAVHAAAAGAGAPSPKDKSAVRSDSASAVPPPQLRHAMAAASESDPRTSYFSGRLEMFLELGDASALLVRVGLFEEGTAPGPERARFCVSPPQQPLSSPIAMPFHEHLPQKAYPEAADNYAAKLKQLRSWSQGVFWLPGDSEPDGHPGHGGF